MNWVKEQRKTATAQLEAELAKPFKAEPRTDGVTYSEDEFDPWEMFPCVYGSYSSDFDDLALDVLRDIQRRTYNREDLASEMFREMLCVAGFCDYGTSPRVCFWNLDKGLLDALITRWSEWSERKWYSD